MHLKKLLLVIPMLSFRRSKNLKEIWVRAKIATIGGRGQRNVLLRKGHM